MAYAAIKHKRLLRLAREREHHVKKDSEGKVSVWRNPPTKLAGCGIAERWRLSEPLRETTEEDHSKLLLLCRHDGIQAGPMFYELARFGCELIPEKISHA